MDNKENKETKENKMKIGDIVKVKNCAGSYFVQVTSIESNIRNGCDGWRGFVVVPNGAGDFVAAISERDGRRCRTWGFNYQVLEINPDAGKAAVDYPEFVDSRTATERRVARRAAMKANPYYKFTA